MKLLAHYLSAIAEEYPEIINWRENNLNDSLFYSFRSTQYTAETYPSNLHYHDYYELVIVEEGNIRYICEGKTFWPQTGDIILIPPRKLHMSSINAEETLYTRHVFYLYPDAFDSVRCSALTNFLSIVTDGRNLLTLKSAEKRMLLSLLPRLDCALRPEADDLNRALALGLTIEIFYLLSQAQPSDEDAKNHLPQNVLSIQQYIDQNFTEIISVSQVAAHFFYSREYLSRLFRQHFNTTVADYIVKRRVAHCQTLIAQGKTLSEVCYSAGFGSMTAFIRAFRTVTKMTPSQYRSMIRQD